MRMAAMGLRLIFEPVQKCSPVDTGVAVETGLQRIALIFVSIGVHLWFQQIRREA
jgi:hypothetical protein